MVSLIQMMSKAHYVQLIGDYFMKEFLKKYGSRKFLLTLFTNVLGIATILSGYGGKIGLIASITAIVVTTAIYITNERKIDVEAVTKIIKLSIDDYEKIKKLIDEYNEKENQEKNEKQPNDNQTDKENKVE